MKYTIIICLLFVFTNSLKEFNNKFSKEESLLRHNYGSSIEDSEEEEDSVCDAETKDKCKALPITKDNEICCYYEIKDNDKTGKKKCESFPSDIGKKAEVFNLKEFYSYLRERNGYNIIIEGRDRPDKREEIVTCKKGVYRLVQDNVYSEKEKNILKDENHCLNIYHKKLENYEFNTGECTSHLLLDSSKKAGLECGYFEYNITLGSKKTISFNTCNLFNLKLFSKLSKVDEYNYTMFNVNELDSLIYSMGYYDDYWDSFTVEVHNSKGHKIKYDSRTNKYIIEGAGYMLSISKYLFILILILF